jgi:hypothetical protein
MKPLENGVVSPGQISPYDPDFGALVESLAASGRDFERLASPTDKSADAMVSTLWSISHAKGKSKAALAAKASRAEVAKKMLAAGWAGQEGQRLDSTWDAALRARDPSLIDALLDAGLRPWKAGGYWRHTPIGLAMYKKRFDDALTMAKAMTASDVAEACKQMGAMLFDLLDLRALAASGAQELWEDWKSKGLSIDARDYAKPDGTTALMYASGRGTDDFMAAVSILIQWGADPKLVDKDGRSALHSVCDASFISTLGEHERARALRALLGAGADPLAVDARGQKAIDLARSSKWDEGVAILAPFEERLNLDDQLSERDALLGAAVMELRRRGYGLCDPQGHPVDWDQALGTAAAKLSSPKRRAL